MASSFVRFIPFSAARRAVLMLAGAGALYGAGVRAQGTPAPAQPQLSGTTLQGQPFALAQLRGKVVLLMFWSTDCAVCRDKMAELRQNHEGWKGQPFELVLVSMDKRLQDLRDYESVIERMVPKRQRFIALWAAQPGYQDSLGRPAVLPTSYLLDKSGRVVERYEGRIPSQAWDRIAELL